MKKFPLFILSIFISAYSFAQVREIPREVQDAFDQQYPSSTEVEFKDQLVKIHVYFTHKGEKMVATYSNKGDWKETEKEWAFELLNDQVKDGFEKSKYSSDVWSVEEAAIVYLPGGAEQYRIKVKKNDVQKKYLFFNGNGKLLRETITL